MDWNPVILAIPVFFILMMLELIYEAVTRRHTYRLNDALTNINLGVLDQVSGVFFKVGIVGVFALIYEQFSFFNIEPTWWTFLLFFILYDHSYYWSHRMAHEVSLFWGGHVVHHQSEEFNLSVALRQSSTAFLWSFPFYAPLALLGFSPMQLIFVAGWNLLYQFWIHTEHINRLPKWFEAVMNTPSHHRVHHGRDPKYLDKNYAGVFIIWDKLYGTFQPEEERPNYGLTKPLNSWNPIYANFAHYISLFRNLQKSRSFADSAKMLFKKPGWLPVYLGGYAAPQPVPADYAKFDQSPRQYATKIYVFFQFVLIILATASFLFSYKTFEIGSKILISSWIISSLLLLSFYLENRKKWLDLLETLRLVALPIILWKVAQPNFEILLAVGGVAALSLFFYFFISKKSNLRFEKS